PVFRNFDPPFSGSLTHLRLRFPHRYATESAGGLSMAYREVRTMDMEQVIRRWSAGEKIRAIARSTGLARNTVKRIVKVAGESGIQIGDGWPGDSKLIAVRERLGRAGGPESSETEQRLQARKEQIEHWLQHDRLLLTKVHELLLRDGIDASYSSLYRFAAKHCQYGSSGVTVRRIEGEPG